MISGQATDEECQDQWEKIVNEHNYFSGSHQYLTYKAHLSAYRSLIRKNLTVQASLWALLSIVDDDIIKWLNQQGYKIDTSSSLTYEHSIHAAIHKTKNLGSKLQQKENQLAMFNEGLAAKRQEYNDSAGDIDERLATLSMHLGFPVTDELTLARYNNYVKLINKQDGTGKKRHNNR